MAGAAGRGGSKDAALLVATCVLALLAVVLGLGLLDDSRTDGVKVLGVQYERPENDYTPVPLSVTDPNYFGPGKIDCTRTSLAEADAVACGREVDD